MHHGASSTWPWAVAADPSAATAHGRGCGPVAWSAPGEIAYGASARVTVACACWPLRVYVTVPCWPTVPAGPAEITSSESPTALSPILTMTSPCRRPALAAGPPELTLPMTAPVAVADSERLTPRYGWLTLRPFMRASATVRALSLGMAKPTPMLPLDWPEVAIAVLTPMSSPFVLTSAPPELPGLMAASVCSRPEIELTDCCCCPNGLFGWPCSLDWIVRSLALMMP